MIPTEMKPSRRRSQQMPYPRSRFFALLVAGVILAGFSTVRAQVAVDTADAIVGKTVSLPFLFDRADTLLPGTALTFSAELLLTRPTVFYPQTLTAGPALSVTASEIEQRTDSTYRISLSLHVDGEVDAGDTLFLLNGEALAGSDSATDLVMTQVSVDGAAHADLIGRIRSASVGSRLPYVRFAILNPGRPNPTETGRLVTWGFRIDKRTEVEFRIYDMIGRLVNFHRYGILDQGVYLHTFTPDPAFPSGMFIVRLITNSGEDYEIMHVLR